MKVYTDLEQSKRLAKILPLDSADMRYGYIAPYDYSDRMYDGGYDKIPYPKELSDKIQLVEEYASELPCWSLAKLFGIIPVIIERANNICRLRMDKSEEDFDIWYEEVDSGLAQLDLDIITLNMVDACVEMIEKLHNEKLTLWQK